MERGHSGLCESVIYQTYIFSATFIQQIAPRICNPTGTMVLGQAIHSTRLLSSSLIIHFATALLVVWWSEYHIVVVAWNLDYPNKNNFHPNWKTFRKSYFSANQWNKVDRILNLYPSELKFLPVDSFICKLFSVIDTNFLICIYTRFSYQNDNMYTFPF